MNNLNQAFELHGKQGMVSPEVRIFSISASLQVHQWEGSSFESKTSISHDQNYI